VVNFYQRLADAVRALPGVQAAGFIRVLPLAAEIGDAFTEIEDKPLPPGANGRSADWQTATPGLFEAMGMRLVKGRFFNGSDTPDGLQVALINESFAREYFPGEDPLGHRIHTMSGNNGAWRTIVGVVGDYHHAGLLNPAKRTWFIPHNQWVHSNLSIRRSLTLVAKTSTNPLALLPPVEGIIKRMDPDLPVTQVQTMGDVLAAATQEQRFTMRLMAGFAGLALLLAAVGIYGVISYSVSQRTREIGIRLALGANRRTVRGLVLRQGMAPVAVGVTLGLGAALLLTRFLQKLLYGVAPLDPLTFATIPVLLLAVAAGSVLLPAARASQVQPVEALRSE
jgi:predicted permease